MKQLLTFVKAHWQEILITGVFLQSFIAAVYTFEPLIIVGTALGGLILLLIVFEGVNRLQQRRHQPKRGESIAFQLPRRAVVFTVGGLTPMSVGAFSVAEERQIDSQYIRSDYDENNRPIPGTQVAVFASRYSDREDTHA